MGSKSKNKAKNKAKKQNKSAAKPVVDASSTTAVPVTEIVAPVVTNVPENTPDNGSEAPGKSKNPSEEPSTSEADITNASIGPEKTQTKPDTSSEHATDETSAENVDSEQGKESKQAEEQQLPAPAEAETKTQEDSVEQKITEEQKGIEENNAVYQEETNKVQVDELVDPIDPVEQIETILQVELVEEVEEVEEKTQLEEPESQTLETEKPSTVESNKEDDFFASFGKEHSGSTPSPPRSTYKRAKFSIDDELESQKPDDDDDFYASLNAGKSEEDAEQREQTEIQEKTNVQDENKVQDETEIQENAEAQVNEPGNLTEKSLDQSNSVDESEENDFYASINKEVSLKSDAELQGENSEHIPEKDEAKTEQDFEESEEAGDFYASLGQDRKAEAEDDVQEAMQQESDDFYASIAHDHPTETVSQSVESAAEDENRVAEEENQVEEELPIEENTSVLTSVDKHSADAADAAGATDAADDQALDGSEDGFYAAINNSTDQKHGASQQETATLDLDLDEDDLLPDDDDAEDFLSEDATHIDLSLGDTQNSTSINGNLDFLEEDDDLLLSDEEDDFVAQLNSAPQEEEEDKQELPEESEQAVSVLPGADLKPRSSIVDFHTDRRGFDLPMDFVPKRARPHAPRVVSRTGTPQDAPPIGPHSGPYSGPPQGVPAHGAPPHGGIPSGAYTSTAVSPKSSIPGASTLPPLRAAAPPMRAPVRAASTSVDSKYAPPQGATPAIQPDPASTASNSDNINGFLPPKFINEPPQVPLQRVRPAPATRNLANPDPYGFPGMQESVKRRPSKVFTPQPAPQAVQAPAVPPIAQGPPPFSRAAPPSRAPPRSAPRANPYAPPGNAGMAATVPPFNAGNASNAAQQAAPATAGSVPPPQISHLSAHQGQAAVPPPVMPIQAPPQTAQLASHVPSQEPFQPLPQSAVPPRQSVVTPQGRSSFYVPQQPVSQGISPKTQGISPKAQKPPIKTSSYAHVPTIQSSTNLIQKSLASQPLTPPPVTSDAISLSWNLSPQVVQSLPLPLLGPKGPMKNKSKDLEKWIDERLQDLTRGSGLDLPGSLLYKVIKPLATISDTSKRVESIQNVLKEYHTDLRVKHSPVKYDSEANIADIFAKLSAGEREEAMKLALDNNAYAHALIIAHSLGPEHWQLAVDEFVAEDARKSAAPLAFVYRALAAETAEAGKNAISELKPRGETSHIDVDKVEYNLRHWANVASALYGASQSSGDSHTSISANAANTGINSGSAASMAALHELGILLESRGYSEQAQVCFILTNTPVSSIPEFTMPLNNQPISQGNALGGAGGDVPEYPFDSYVLAELSEYALGRGTPALLPYKLRFSEHLAGLGHWNEALKIAETVSNVLKSTKNAPAQLLEAAAHVMERCQQNATPPAGGWLQRKLSRPNLEKTWITSFNKFVSGEDEAGEEDNQSDSNVTQDLDISNASSISGAAYSNGTGLVNPAVSRLQSAAPARPLSASGPINNGTKFDIFPVQRQSYTPGPDGSAHFAVSPNHGRPNSTLLTRPVPLSETEEEYGTNDSTFAPYPQGAVPVPAAINGPGFQNPYSSSSPANDIQSPPAMGYHGPSDTESANYAMPVDATVSSQFTQQARAPQSQLPPRGYTPHSHSRQGSTPQRYTPQGYAPQSVQPSIGQYSPAPYMSQSSSSSVQPEAAGYGAHMGASPVNGAYQDPISQQPPFGYGLPEQPLQVPSRTGFTPAQAPYSQQPTGSPYQPIPQQAPQPAFQQGPQQSFQQPLQQNYIPSSAPSQPSVSDESSQVETKDKEDNSKKEEDSKDDDGTKRGWFGWFKKEDPTQKKVHNVKLGDSKKVVFDKELGRWIKEGDPRPEPSKGPPPPPKSKAGSAAPPNLQPVSHAHGQMSPGVMPTNAVASQPMAEIPPQASSTPPVLLGNSSTMPPRPKPNPGGGFDDILAAASATGSSRSKRRPARSRYVGTTDTGMPTGMS